MCDSVLMEMHPQRWGDPALAAPLPDATRGLVDMAIGTADTPAVEEVSLYGVRAADYQTVSAALFDALAAVLGDDFDPETRQAWAVAYNLMAETMLDGAASARPVGR